ncbi:MAG: hypothetical protein Q7T44_00855 [Parvibaculum sp.]|nr:hypothetical protein [Parvibaculum sp.]
MTNFMVGAVLGFLVCVWATETTPTVAFAALWHRLELVQQASSAANQSYDAMRLGKPHEAEVVIPVERQTDQR